MRRKKFKLVINGEGEGSIHSLLSVVSEVQIMCTASEIRSKIIYLGSYEEYKLILEANAIKVHGISSGGFFGKIFGFIQALWWLYFFMPDVILSNGGRTAPTVFSAGRFYLIPTVFHEENAFPEAIDQRAARKAKIITLAYESATKYFPVRVGKSESYFVGEPIRSYILPKQSPTSDGGTNQISAKTALNFNASKLLILVINGSHETSSLNRFIVENLPFILPLAQVLHQTGIEYYEGAVARVAEIAKEVPQELLNGYRAVDYFDKDIKNAYMAADLVIARSGSPILAELAAFGKPAILIPAPESIDPTERYNAGEYANTGAAMVIEEENLLPNMFLSTLQSLLEDKQKLTSMAKAASSKFKPRAATDLARIIMDFGSKTV